MSIVTVPEAAWQVVQPYLASLMDTKRYIKDFTGLKEAWQSCESDQDWLTDWGECVTIPFPFQTPVEVVVVIVDQH